MTQYTEYEDWTDNEQEKKLDDLINEQFPIIIEQAAKKQAGHSVMRCIINTHNQLKYYKIDGKIIDFHDYMIDEVLIPNYKYYKAKGQMNYTAEVYAIRDALYYCNRVLYTAMGKLSFYVDDHNPATICRRFKTKL